MTAAGGKGNTVHENNDLILQKLSKSYHGQVVFPI